MSDAAKEVVVQMPSAVTVSEDGTAFVELLVTEIAVRPSREIPAMVAGLGSGRKGGSVYTKLVVPPDKRWAIRVPMDASTVFTLDGLASVVGELFSQTDMSLVLAEGASTAKPDKPVLAR